jgi:hypothetical protein
VLAPLFHGATHRAEAHQVQLVLGDLIALFLRHGPGCLIQCTLQLRRRVDVCHLSAPRTDEVVVVARQLLGQLEATVVVGARNPAHHADVDERGHVPIRAALGELRG